MTSKELQTKFNKLTDELQLAKIEKARLEERLERDEVELKKLEESLLKSTGAKTVLEAKESLEIVRKSLEEKIKEAEALLGD